MTKGKQHIIYEEDYNLTNFDMLPKMTRTYTLIDKFFEEHKEEKIRIKLVWENLKTSGKPT